MVTRDAIERTLSELNEAENDPTLDAQMKSAVVDRLSTPDVQGWANGEPRGGRDDERQQEAFLWSTFPDYHRAFERIVIEPPSAAVQWTVAGSSPDLDMQLELAGATIFTFSDDGKIHRFWLYYHDPLKT